MTGWPFVGRRERLRRQASVWVARLSGPHEQGDRAAFERWYHADPEHAASYHRLAMLFDAAAHVPAQAYQPAVRRSPTAWSPRHAFAAMVVLACASIALLLVFGLHGAGPSAAPAAQVASFSAPSTGVRRLRLVDGSEVVLAPASELDVRLDGAQRWLRLRRGEGEFAVSHEPRPFVVAAANAKVVARGTRFTVRLEGARTVVSLIEGRIEVSYGGARDRADRHVAHLTAGQRVVVPPSQPMAMSAASGPATPAMIELDDTRLSEAVARINRSSERKVRVADPSLADRRVTGAFRTGDAEGFARSVAAALGLDVEIAGDGTLWLRAAPGHR